MTSQRPKYSAWYGYANGLIALDYIGIYALVSQVDERSRLERSLGQLSDANLAASARHVQQMTEVRTACFVVAAGAVCVLIMATVQERARHAEEVQRVCSQACGGLHRAHSCACCV